MNISHTCETKIEIQINMCHFGGQKPEKMHIKVKGKVQTKIWKKINHLVSHIFHV